MLAQLPCRLLAEECLKYTKCLFPDTYLPIITLVFPDTYLEINVALFPDTYLEINTAVFPDTLLLPTMNSCRAEEGKKGKKSIK